MPIVKNTGGDLNFPGVSLRNGDNMVAAANWERLKSDPSIVYYLTLGRLSVGDGQAEAKADPAQPKSTVAVTIEQKPQHSKVAPVEPKKAAVDFSALSTKDLAEKIAEMSKDDLSELEASGDERKGVIKAIKARKHELGIED